MKLKARMLFLVLPTWMAISIVGAALGQGVNLFRSGEPSTKPSLLGSLFGDSQQATRQVNFEKAQAGAKQQSTREEPVAFFTKDDANNPKDAELAIARLCERRGELAQAEQVYIAYMKAHPEVSLPYHRMGIIAARQNRYDAAHRYFQKAFSIEPQSFELLRDIGYAYYLQERFDDAETAMRRALAFRSNDEAICNNLGLVLGMKGEFDEALLLFKRVGTPGKAYANLAYVYSQRGDLKSAEDAYLKALTYENDLKVAGKALLQVAEKRKHLEKTLAKRQAQLAAEGKQIVFTPEDSTKFQGTNLQEIGRQVVNERSRATRGATTRDPFEALPGEGIVPLSSIGGPTLPSAAMASRPTATQHTSPAPAPTPDRLRESIVAADASIADRTQGPRVITMPDAFGGECRPIMKSAVVLDGRPRSDVPPSPNACYDISTPAVPASATAPIPRRTLPPRIAPKVHGKPIGSSPSGGASGMAVVTDIVDPVPVRPRVRSTATPNGYIQRQY